MPRKPRLPEDPRIERTRRLLAGDPRPYLANMERVRAEFAAWHRRALEAPRSDEEASELEREASKLREHLAKHKETIRRAFDALGRASGTLRKRGPDVTKLRERLDSLPRGVMARAVRRWQPDSGAPALRALVLEELAATELGRLAAGAGKAIAEYQLGIPIGDWLNYHAPRFPSPRNVDLCAELNAGLRERVRKRAARPPPNRRTPRP